MIFSIKNAVLYIILLFAVFSVSMAQAGSLSDPHNSIRRLPAEHGQNTYDPETKRALEMCYANYLKSDRSAEAFASVERCRANQISKSSNSVRYVSTQQHNSYVVRDERTRRDIRECQFNNNSRAANDCNGWHDRANNHDIRVAQANSRISNRNKITDANIDLRYSRQGVRVNRARVSNVRRAAGIRCNENGICTGFSVVTMADAVTDGAISKIANKLADKFVNSF